MTELDRHLDAFGARLAAAEVPRRRARRGPLAIAFAGAAAALAAIAVVLAASGDRSLDPVAEARAALAPPGEIVYMKITTSHSSPGAGSVPPSRTAEQWSVADPRRWRIVEVLPRPRPGRGAMLDEFGLVFGRVEMSYAGGVARRYLAQRDTLVVTSGYSDRSSAARLPSQLGQGSGNPDVDLRSLLLQGEVSDRGEQLLRGRPVRRFVIERERVARNDPRTVLRMVYDVDPQTFAPIEGRITMAFGSGGPPRITTRLRVDAYERIPLTPQTAKLLKIQTTPRTKTTFDTAQRLRARARAWRAKCRTLKSGALSCPPPFPAPKLPRPR